MTPSWLNNYLGQPSPYGVSQMNTTPDWLQQAIPSQTPVPYGASMTDLSQVGNVSAGSPMSKGMPLALLSQLLGQPKQMQVARNELPMGRNVSYQDILKSYGITGLMG